MSRPSDWQARAACHESDPDVFFPPMGSRGEEARRICRICPVASACLDYALDDPSLIGIWGGTSDTERKTFKRTLRRQIG